MFKKFVRKISAWAWVDEADTFNGLARIKSLSMDEKKLDLEIEQNPLLGQYIAKCFASMLVNSPNYTEITFDLAPKYKEERSWITVLVQKQSGQTPHQLRIRAEKERDELRAKLAIDKSST